MSHNNGYDWRLFELLPKGKTYIDVGAGEGYIGIKLRINNIATKIIAIEGYEPYCKTLLYYHAYDEVINKNIFEVSKGFIYENVVLCCDVIEHNDFKLSDTFIEILESLGDIIVITTPNGFMKNEALDDKNKLNKHRSYYSKEFFEDRGYTVEIVRYYPDAPKIFRALIKLYWWVRGSKKVDSQIIAIKEMKR